MLSALRTDPGEEELRKGTDYHRVPGDSPDRDVSGAESVAVRLTGVERSTQGTRDRKSRHRLLFFKIQKETTLEEMRDSEDILFIG